MRVNSFMRYGNVLAILVAGLMAFALTACDIPTESDHPTSTATIWGKVVNSRTQEGVGGATVGVKTNGTWSVDTTDTSTTAFTNGDGTDTPLGDFAITGLPASMNGNVPLYVKSPSDASYVTHYSSLSISNGGPGLDGDGSHNVGNISLQEGVALTIYVVDRLTGALVRRTGNAAIKITPSFGPASGDAIAAVSAAQDSTDLDKYTLTVRKDSSVTLTSQAFDSDGDTNGTLDYSGSSETVSATQIKAGDTTVIINVDSFSLNGGSITLDKDNFISEQVRAGSSSDQGSLRYLAKGSNIELIFNQPVYLAASGEPTTQQVGLYYIDDLKALGNTTASLPTGTSVTVTTTVSDLGGHKLKVDPSADLTENETYSLNVFLRGYFLDDRQTSGADVRQEYSTDTSFTVTYTGTDGLSSTSSNASLDNINGCNKGAQLTTTVVTACSTSNTLNLMFTEPVWGDGQIIKITSVSGTTTTTTASGSTFSVACTTMGYYTAESTSTTTNSNNGSTQTSVTAISNNPIGVTLAYTTGGIGAATAGVRCAQSLSGFTSGDSAQSATSSITYNIYLDILDINGNNFIGTVDFPVQ